MKSRGFVQRALYALGVLVAIGICAAAVALLWILHPLQTEAVTYIVQRAESLMGMFFLLTFYGFGSSADGYH